MLVADIYEKKRVREHISVVLMMFYLMIFLLLPVFVSFYIIELWVH